ncbi:AMP-binding protein [Inhella sp.]|uniref:AMP-binding protein n=1 Tax=Inhella sp. TaxID=1921806 RepID=UPI0035AD7C14
MRPVFETLQRRWSASEWAAEVHRAAEALRGHRVVASLLDNGAAFALLDEALRHAGIVHLPLPLFFTPAQRQHALRAAGVDLLLLPHAAAAALPGASSLPPWLLGGEALARMPLPHASVQLPPGTQTLSFTSGSTGEPKGVGLSAAALDAVRDGVVATLGDLGIERHLSALPYAVLLENLAGLAAARHQGATVLAQPLASLGLQGASQFDAARFDAVVRERAPNSLILLPQMLRAWVAHLQRERLGAPPSLRLVAVGGAAVGAPLVEAALRLGLPVAEGYGLTEGASVQTLNRPGRQRPGSAGSALPHARLRVADDGEVWIGGTLFSGYLGEPGSGPQDGWWPTGDLGRLDADGHLHLQGRKKNLLITAFGRNVSPEWVETALRSQPAIGQAVVFGEAQPALAAVLWPSRADLPQELLQSAVDAANADLPDYARIAHWTRGRAPFDAASGLATPNGRPRREAILALHGDSLFQPEASRP